MIRKFLNDTVDLVVDALASLGLLRGGSQWWRMRMERRLGDLSQDAENRRRAVRAAHRMCPECRALVLGRERRCTECGASMSGVPKGGAGRLLSMFVPSLGSASLTIVGLIVAIALATIVATSPGGLSLFSSDPESTRRFYALLTTLGDKQRLGYILATGEWWRLVNPIFLHGGLLHVGFNAYALANLGPVIEQMVGTRRFVVVFLATGIFSFLVSAVASANPAVGASGAIFGLIGFGIVHGTAHGGAGGQALASQLMRWAIFGVLLIFLPMPIDHFAHFGGFAAGAALGWLVRGPRVAGAPVERLWGAAAVALGLLPVVGFGLALLEAAG